MSTPLLQRPTVRASRWPDPGRTLVASSDPVQVFDAEGSDHFELYFSGLVCVPVDKSQAKDAQWLLDNAEAFLPQWK